MKQFSRKLFFLFLGVSLTACSQKKETMINQNPTITADNIVYKIVTEIKHYEYEPLYLISFDINNSFFELLVNDIPIYKGFNSKSPSLSTAEEINLSILKSGTQKVTIKLYPVDGELVFGQNTGAKIRLGSVDAKIKWTDTGKRDLYVFKTDSIKDKPYYETTQTFTIHDLPYQNIGWSESQDLRQMDKVALEKTVLAYYKEIQEIITSKDKDMLAKISYNKMRDQFVSQYGSKEEVQEAWDEVLDILNADEIVFYPIEAYELVFYGEGKLVGLKSKQLKKGFRGANVLLCKYRINEKWKGIELYYLLHIPKGETEFKVY